MGYNSERDYANSIYDSMADFVEREKRQRELDTSVGMNEINTPFTEAQLGQAYRDIWNAAIEAAALEIDRLNREGPYMAITGATEIRKLKK